MLCFRAARAAVGDALVDSQWTASTEQREIFDQKTESELSELPPAVVLDVDETVLDNSRYQVGLIESGGEYSREGWKAYVESQVATPIPGAVDFVKACRTAGVTVIYVTNREHEVESATRENLIKHGLMEEGDPDLIFTKYEKEEWTSDKKSRRQELAQKYRILLLLGDDLNDFMRGLASVGSSFPTPTTGAGSSRCMIGKTLFPHRPSANVNGKR